MVLSCRCKTLCPSGNTVLGETQKQKEPVWTCSWEPAVKWEWVSISQKRLILFVSACPDLPHPARRPLQILPGSGKILLCSRHIGFQVKYTLQPACRCFMFIFSCTLCLFTTTVLTRRNMVTHKLCFTFPRQKRLRHRRLLAKVPDAWRGAGAAQKFYPEQEDGVQRLQAVPVRPRAGWVAEHVYRPAVLKSVFDSLVSANRLWKSEDLASFFFWSELLLVDKKKNKPADCMVLMQSHRLWVWFWHEFAHVLHTVGFYHRNFQKAGIAVGYVDDIIVCSAQF